MDYGLPRNKYSCSIMQRRYSQKMKVCLCRINKAKHCIDIRVQKGEIYPCSIMGGGGTKPKEIFSPVNKSVNNTLHSFTPDKLSCGEVERLDRWVETENLNVDQKDDEDSF